MKGRGVVLLAALTGCAGARTEIDAPRAHYPISLSRGVRDARGEVASGDRLAVVGTFEETRTAWGLLYSAIALDPTTDISDAVDAQVAKARGDAVVRLRVAAGPCWADIAIPLVWLPIWPTCVRVVVTGRIVQVRDAAAGAPAHAEAR